MFRPEYDPDECVSCRTCKACGVGIHSCCSPVVCRDTNRSHWCNCQAAAHDDLDFTERRLTEVETVKAPADGYDW